MTIYVDVLFLQNLAMNFIILATTSHLLKSNTSILKLLLGASIGALYVVVALMPQFAIYVTMLSKFLLSLVIISVTFMPYKLKDLIKYTAMFYLISFVFGGACLGLFYFTNSQILMHNGVTYIGNYTLKLILIYTAVGYMVIRICWDFLRVKLNKESIFEEITIVFMQNKKQITSLIDTGNSLKDPLTNKPVLVVEYDVIKEMLPLEIQEVYSKNKEFDFESVTEAIEKTDMANRFRLIPFSALGTTNGILLGFKPDKVIATKDEMEEVRDVVIGVYNKKLSSDGKYNALMAV